MAKTVDVKFISRYLSAGAEVNDPMQPVITSKTMEVYLKSFFDQGYELFSFNHLGVQQPEGVQNVFIVLVKHAE
jgi:hypothetical protein